MTWFGANKVRSISSKTQRNERTERTEQKYLVATGAVIFSQRATSDREALLLVKERLFMASKRLPNNVHDPERLSGALLESFMEGKLDFIVMDEERTRVLCGEYAGVFESPVSRRLLANFKDLIPPVLEMRQRAALRMRVTASSTINEGKDRQKYA